MPETRVERALFVLGLVAIAVLVLLIVHFRHHSHGVAGAAATTRPGAATTAAATTTDSTTSVRTRTTTTTHATVTTPAAALVSLGLTARADTWLEVRSGSATGPILYGGTLAAGSHEHFRAASLWARFGAAGNVSARLDGKALRLPSGTYSATFDGHGFRRLGS
jgi:RodZ C-terminal domain